MGFDVLLKGQVGSVAVGCKWHFARAQLSIDHPTVCLQCNAGYAG